MDEFIGTVKAFAFGFTPRGWFSCQGQLLDISTHQTLFSLLGTTYGGDGRRTFALPDMRGHAPIGQGQAPGFSNRRMGEKGGAETNVLSEAQMHAHTHSTNFENQGVNAFVGQPVVESPPTTTNPSTNVLAQANIYAVSNPGKETNLAPFNAPVVGTSTSSSVGSNAPINNMQPFLTLNYCICYQGIYPPRN